jgi:hypothetical protein
VRSVDNDLSSPLTLLASIMTEARRFDAPEPSQPLESKRSFVMLLLLCLTRYSVAIIRSTLPSKNISDKQ